MVFSLLFGGRLWGVFEGLVWVSIDDFVDEICELFWGLQYVSIIAHFATNIRKRYVYRQGCTINNVYSVSVEKRSLSIDT